ncbi:MAG TPA: efflux RND transporter permease subunit, partial [Pseudothauera hydrothermalis]|nr:efflux RND transporter permease subunit [Pseudothauera hydrothermalis]
EDALRRQNVQVPAARIESAQREFAVVAATDLSRPEEFEAVVVRAPVSADDYPVRLRDLGRVEEAASSERTLVRFMGKPAASVGLIKQATANPLDLKRGLVQMLPALQAELPEGMTMTIANDTTVFIERSISAVFATIFEAIVLVALICLFFLRNGRAMLVPLVTIPVSLIGACALMLLFGFSINTLTLLALVLAVGLVVDDAIVMLENIYRHIEEGMPPLQAAFQGSREIAFAVIAMTLTLAAVYAPVAFMSGRTGKLFTEFALTLAGAVLVSGFVALTLSPMMCAKMLRHQPAHGRLYNAIERFLEGLTARYRTALVRALQMRGWVMLVFALVAGSTVLLFGQLKQELAPIEDRGRVIGLFSGPEAATVDYMARYAAQLEHIYAKTADVDRYMVISGSPTVSQGISFVGFTDWTERRRSATEIAAELRAQMNDIPGVRAFPSLPAAFGQGARSRPVTFVVMASASYEEMAHYTDLIIDEISAHPGFIAPESDLKLTQPELVVEVDRDRA